MSDVPLLKKEVEIIRDSEYHAILELCKRFPMKHPANEMRYDKAKQYMDLVIKRHIKRRNDDVVGAIKELKDWTYLAFQLTSGIDVTKSKGEILDQITEYRELLLRKFLGKYKHLFGDVK